MIKNAKFLDEKELMELKDLYVEYMMDHYLRLTNGEARVSELAINRRCNNFAESKISEINDGGRIVLVHSGMGFIECQLSGSVAVLNYVFVTYNEIFKRRLMTLELYRALADILECKFGISQIVARSYVEDEEFNRTLCALGFEIDEMGAATITSGKTI